MAMLYFIRARVRGEPKFLLQDLRGWTTEEKDAGRFGKDYAEDLLGFLQVKPLLYPRGAWAEEARP